MLETQMVLPEIKITIYEIKTYTDGIKNILKLH